MSNWNAGYVSDVPYVPGYYPEQSPEFIRFAMLFGGVLPAGLGSSRPAYCELGFGYGFGLGLLAAANPDIDFYGNDFLPEHVAFARELTRDLTNAHLFEDSFQEFAARDDLPDFDFIALHGIWSWISPENQGHILDFVRRRLKPGGALYIGYNAQPGWHVIAPLRGALAIHAQLAAPEGMAASEKTRQALEFVHALQKNNSQTIVGNRAILDRIEQLRKQPIEYAAHEYLNEQWRPLYFSEVAAQLAQAKLSFTASTKVLRMLDNFNLAPEAKQHLGTLANPVLREVARDFYLATAFRQDVFSRGARRLQLAERDALLERTRLMLVKPAGEVPMKFPTPIGESNLNEPIYKPVLELLGARGAEGATVGELHQTSGLKGKSGAIALEVATILIGIEAAVPIVDDRATARSASAEALNSRIIEFVNAGHVLGHMASPLLRGAYPVDRISALLLQAYRLDIREVKAMAEHAWGKLEKMGHRMMKDGKPIQGVQDNLLQLQAAAQEFLAKTAPRLSLAGLL